MRVGRIGATRYPLFVALSLLAAIAGVAAVAYDDGLIARGVHVQGLDLSGMTPAAAHKAIETEFATQLPADLTLTAGDKTFTLDNAALGRNLDVDGAVAEAERISAGGSVVTRALRRLRLTQVPQSIPLVVAMDEAKLASALEELAPQVARQPRNARVKSLRAKPLRIDIEEAQDGTELDVAATVAAVTSADRLPVAEEATLVLKRTPPKVVAADLQRGMNTVLATYRTNMSRGYTSPARENRRHNVELCIERFTGVVLAPGETFSFNGLIGERRRQDGFKDSYVFKRQPDGSIDEEWESGGGICQLSTTLFGAAVLANTKITERRPHSKVVGYAPIARDAAVYWGQLDLKFKNTLSNPIMVWAAMEGWDLVVTIVGDASDQYEVEMISNSFNGASGRGGTLWRKVTRPDGGVVDAREWVADSFYPHAKPKPPPPTAKKPETQVKAAEAAKTATQEPAKAEATKHTPERTETPKAAPKRTPRTPPAEPVAPAAPEPSPAPATSAPAPRAEPAPAAPAAAEPEPSADPAE